MFVLAALVVACQPKAIPMTPEEAQRVETLTANMTTRCVGRYLIDMPLSFALHSESNTEIEGVKIDVRPLDKRLFEMALEAKQAELNRTKFHGDRSELPFVRAITSLPAPSVGVLIDRAEGPDTSRLSRRLEVLGWRDGYQISAFIDATDNTFPEHANDSIAKQLGNDTPEKLAHLLKVFERISGRKDTEIPTEQGVCFANGFVKGPATDEEVLFIRHNLENSPDVGSTFHSLSDITEDTELLDRSAAIEADLKERSGRTLRKGKSLAQIPGAQEWLMTKKGRDSDLMVHAMTLEANSKIGSATTPVVVFNLNAGGGYRTQAKSNEEAATRPPLITNTFSEAESVAIWDKITATLRPRPGAF
jgi:hypothetical protein